MALITQTPNRWTRWHTRLQKTLISKTNLLPHRSCLLLAISGGQDSMTLAKLFLDLQRLYEWEIAIWHGDHKWHSQSTQFAQELQNWCAKNNLNFTCEKAAKGQFNSEEKARKWRYQQLTKYAQVLSRKNPKSNTFKVLTGHTANDRAETFLLHLARGAHLRGLGSLRYERTLEGQIKLIRPLLSFTRKDTYEFCKDMNLPIWIDPSNSNTNLSRNRVRKDIIPVLEELHPGASLRIGSLSERISHLNDDQKSLNKLIINEIKNPEGLSRTKLIQLTVQARATILAEWLNEFTIPSIKATQLEEISNKTGASKPPGKKHLGKGWEIQWDQKVIRVCYTEN